MTQRFYLVIKMRLKKKLKRKQIKTNKTLNTRRTLSGHFSLIQNNLGSALIKIYGIAKILKDPWLSEYEEKMICYERKKTDNGLYNAKKCKKTPLFCSSRF